MARRSLSSVTSSGIGARCLRTGVRALTLGPVLRILDARTGEPVEGMCQVSVVASDATASDALTKAAFVLDRDAVLQLFTRLGPSVHALRVEGLCGERTTVWRTPWSGEVLTPVPPEEGPAGYQELSYED